jgi:proline iminopeptidase
MRMAWRSHLLPIDDGELAWFEAGSGPPVIMLSGGPGDDHSYLRALAEPLSAHLRCILFDQRGTGATQLARLTPETLHIDRVCDDVEALRVELGLEQLRLAGHSWGATLALYYGTRFPQRVDRLALLGPGPMRAELDAVCEANLSVRLSADERAERDGLRAARHTARQAGDLDAQRELHLELMERFDAARLVYQPDVVERFRAAYRAGYSYQPLANQLVYASLDRERLWRDLPAISTPALIVYGYQDFEPITQAYDLREQMPQLEIHFLNACGHELWLDQPDATQALLRRFLTDAAVA